jgi:hypothetical protein
MTRPGFEPGPPRLEAGATNRLSYGAAYRSTLVMPFRSLVSSDAAIPVIHPLEDGDCFCPFPRLTDSKLIDGTGTRWHPLQGRWSPRPCIWLARSLSRSGYHNPRDIDSLLETWVSSVPSRYRSGVLFHARTLFHKVRMAYVVISHYASWCSVKHG